MDSQSADLILHHARLVTLDEDRPEASAVAIKDGRFIYVGDDEGARRFARDTTLVVDAEGRRGIPGLNDSHLHVIRAGLNYNLELRWESVESVDEALATLRTQAARTPRGQWVRVVGGWSEFQFRERRMPTLDEINAVAPDTPVFVLHLYHCALLNKAALRAVGYTRDTPSPPGGEIVKDALGEPTGLLVAKPNAMILYATLAKAPKLDARDQLNGTIRFLRELNGLGLTSAIDAGGGFQNYPQDYDIIRTLWEERALSLRIAYNLFTQRPKQEFEDFATWTRLTAPGNGDAWYRVNGAGEMLVFSAADFENFLEPRPELPASLEAELVRVLSLLVERRWPFRLHATYEESIRRFLDVIEEVDGKTPLRGLRWWFDHCETISDASLDRVKALGGGIAVQDRMAFQGEHFLARYGASMAARSPPLRQMMERGIPVGAGTDATRVSSYNPWVSLAWLVTGKTVGGTTLYPPENCLSRIEALRLYTVGSAWFSGEEAQKGRIAPGQLADLALLSQDYLQVADDDIRRLRSVLTIVGGRIVHGAGVYGALAPPSPVATPAWSPGNLEAPDPREIHAALQGRPATHAGHEHAVFAEHGGIDSCGC